MSLWQKPEAERTARPAAGTATPTPVSTPTPTTTNTGGVSAWEKSNNEGNLVNIGQSIQIKGELTGNEDLTVDGKIEGKIVLNGHNLTIGKNGQITAEICAKSVLVEGEVIGNVKADDKVEISSSGSVHGDLTAPRVALADGSCFKGSIDMGGSKTTDTKTTGVSAASVHGMAARGASAPKS